MTDLRGTDKQVAWAQSIREKWLEEAKATLAEKEAQLAAREAEGSSTRFIQKDVKTMTGIISTIEDIKDAQWIIDHRMAGQSFGSYSHDATVWHASFDGIRDAYKKIF
jgi:hypothetical protein